MMATTTRKLIYGFLLVCPAGLVWAEDLRKAYQDALANDARYAAALAQQRAGEERLALGRAGLLPQISFNAQTGWGETEYTVVHGTINQRRQNRSYGVQLVQPLFRPQNWVEYQQGGLHAALAEVQERSAAQDLILRLAQAYFNVLQAEDLIRVLSRMQAFDTEMLSGAQKKFRLGAVSIIDVHEAQVSRDSTAVQLLKARSELDRARYKLARITGKESQSLKRLRDGATVVAPQPLAVNAWITAARQGSLEIRRQEIILHLSASEVRLRKMGHWPSVDLVLSQNMQQDPSPGTRRSESAAIGLRLSMPLFSGGRLSAGAREAAALHAQAGYELEDVQRAVALAAHEAWSVAVDGIGQVKALKAASVSAQAAVDANRLGYQVGTRTGSDVLKAQGQLSEVMQQWARTRYDVLMAQLQLKAAVGALAHDDLMDVNSMLGDDWEPVPAA